MFTRISFGDVMVVYKDNFDLALDLFLIVPKEYPENIYNSFHSFQIPNNFPASIRLSFDFGVKCSSNFDVFSSIGFWTIQFVGIDSPHY